jgi:O-antigen ligase
MNQTVQWSGEDKYERPGFKPSRRQSFLKFLMRYPIFLLAFGPPLFRSGEIDATKGVIDVWSFLQVGILGAIATRAIHRLASAESISIPKKIRSILKLAFLLGLVFLASAVYSPSHLVSAAYSLLYLLTLICVVEFVADVYKDPPDWMQCLFHLRFIALILFALVLLTFIFAPSLVVSVEEVAGLRFRGGAVAPLPVICPVIAIISAYSFLYGIESRGRSLLFFLVGLAGTFSTQSRGAELALLLSLAILGVGWAKAGKRSAYLFIFGLMAFVLFSGVFVGAVGGDRIWYIFNRGGNAADITTASGRTDIWKFVFQYCIAHPQGMGYVSGFRNLFRQYFALGLQFKVTGIGNTHNAFIDILAGAGWLALAIYLIMVIRIILLGLRFAKTRTLVTVASDNLPWHALRCALVLFISCLAGGMDSSDFTIPLRAPSYWQNTIVAIILGVSARMLVASRARNLSSTG